MEPSPTPSKFRSRDHREFQDSMHSEPSSDDVSSVSSDPNSAPDIKSMTGRGIKLLCSELLELKIAAHEDLQKNIFTNYSAFIRILEEVREVENEFLQLEKHLVTHKRLVKELIDRIYPMLLSEEETINSTFEDHIDTVPSAPCELEVYIHNVSEKLDILLSENRIDEALNLLQSADEYYQSIEDYSSNSQIILYDSLISERKSMLIERLTQIVEHPTIARPELQKALAGLCRLGDSQLAVHLLLKYYRSRIQAGIYNLQWSKSFSNLIYIRELAKLVFSIISQAASSFVTLCGESSPHASELIVWACEETKSLVTCLDKYIKSIADIRGGLSTAIEVVQFAVSYCSLLENQRLILRPYMIRHLCPCMEEVLHQHINHFKKVIAIFSASDPWVLERYVVSEVFGEGSSSLAVRQLPEYCLLTNSGRKFLTLLQAFIEDISPLVALQMGGSVISGLKNLFTEYNVILERALTSETRVTEKGSPRIRLAESLPQQVSVLANLSTLVQFLSVMVKSIFGGISCMDVHLMENHSVLSEQKELDNFLSFIEEGSHKLRYKFCQNFILKVLSTHSSHEFTSAIHNNDHCDANTTDSLIPSNVCQILFIELRKLEQLAEEKVFEVDWLMCLLRELMESMLIWFSKNKENHANTTNYMSSEPNDSKQFFLDMQFLVEIGMYGGYFSNDPLLLLTLIKSAFYSAGLDPFRDANDDEWAIEIANKTIQKLLKIENQSTRGGDFSHKDDISSSVNKIDSEAAVIEKDETEAAIDAEVASLNMEFSSQEGSLDLVELKKDYVGKSTSNLRQTNIQLENTESLNAANAESDELQIADRYNILAPASSVDDAREISEETKSRPNEVSD